MAKHLTDANIKAIINLIDGWAGEKITWDKICESCLNVVGKIPTRQSLYLNKNIKQAYETKKKSLKIQGPRKPLPANLKVAADRIKRLESIVTRLTEENNKLHDLFVIWQYNAYKRGITERQLNESLPRIDRDRTETQEDTR